MRVSCPKLLDAHSSSSPSFSVPSTGQGHAGSPGLGRGALDVPMGIPLGGGEGTFPLVLVTVCLMEETLEQE